MKREKRWMACVAGLLLLATVPAAAQIRLGVRGGMNVASVRFSSGALNTSHMTSFHIGPALEAMAPLLGIGIDAALLYSQKGMEAADKNMKTNYIDVPVHLKWKFGLPIVKCYLMAGPYAGFRLSGTEVWEIPGTVSDQVKSKSFGAGLDFGAGVELLKFVEVGLLYGFGLTDNYSLNGVGLSGSGKNRNWSISATIWF